MDPQPLTALGALLCRGEGGGKGFAQSRLLMVLDQAAGVMSYYRWYFIICIYCIYIDIYIFTWASVTCTSAYSAII